MGAVINGAEKSNIHPPDCPCEYLELFFQACNLLSRKSDGTRELAETSGWGWGGRNSGFLEVGLGAGILSYLNASTPASTAPKNRAAQEAGWGRGGLLAHRMHLRSCLGTGARKAGGQGDLQLGEGPEGPCQAPTRPF